MLTHVDSDGFSSLIMLEGIIDFQKDESLAVRKTDKYLTTTLGQKQMRKTTVGWLLLVKWADRTESWIPLKDLKESHPIETTMFAKARSKDDEPTFAWWVPYRLRKRDIIFSKINAHIGKTTHTYGIEIPTSIVTALEID